MTINHKGWDWRNEKSPSWDSISEEFLPVAQHWVREFESVLDIGAGKGRHSFYFAENGLDVTALDLSETGIQMIQDEAEKRNLEVKAIVADMTNLPFDNESFDAVICFHSIYHSSYEGVKKAISEIRRVLKENGEAYITFNTKDNPNFKEEKTIDGHTIISESGNEKGMPHCFIDEKEVYELLYPFRIMSFSKIYNYVRNERNSHGVHFYLHIKK